MNTDLFGQPLPDPPAPATDEVPDRVSNDIDEVAAVLRLADRDGYSVVGLRHYQVWRHLTNFVVEPVCRHEADTVRQLLDAGWLTLGATQSYDNPHGAEVSARPVHIPLRTRHWMARQADYKQLRGARR